MTCDCNHGWPQGLTPNHTNQQYDIQNWVWVIDLQGKIIGKHVYRSKRPLTFELSYMGVGHDMIGR